MAQVNLYLSKRDGWEMGTPLNTWIEKVGMFKKKITYRYRPLGQDRGMGKGLMGLMADEGNCHATEMKSLDISYEDALDQLLERFLSDYKSGNIQPEKRPDKDPQFRFIAGWKSGWNYFVGFGSTAKKAIEDLKNDLIEHIKQLKENSEYRNFHVREGGPTYNPFPNLTAMIDGAIARRKKMRWIFAVPAVFAILSVILFLI